jgi:hypothetical protein
LKDVDNLVGSLKGWGSSVGGVRRVYIRCADPDQARTDHHDSLSSLSFSDFLLYVFRVQFGKTPLHIASKEGNTEMVTVLLSAKADVNLANQVR